MLTTFSGEEFEIISGVLLFNTKTNDLEFALNQTRITSGISVKVR